MAPIALFFSLALTLRSDDVTLADGTRIQGKVLKKTASEVVIQVDESGTTRTVPAAEVKTISPSEAPWTARKRNLKTYEQKLKALKAEDWKSQFDLAQWCRKSSLTPEADRHMERAIELRKAKTANTAAALVELGQWCAQNGMTRQADEAFAAAFDLKKTELKENRSELAKWAEGLGLVDIARREFEAALPSPEAKAGLKRLSERWSPEDAAWIEELKKQGRAWTLSFGVADDADEAYLAEWEEKIRRISRYIFDVTEGQFFIAEATLEDKATATRVTIPAGRMRNTRFGDQGVAICRGTGSPNWRVEVGGYTAVGACAHELVHGYFGILDEYGSKPECPCLMANAPAPHRLCDATNHVNSGPQKEPCWSVIVRKFGDKGVRHPNPDWTVVSEGKDGSYDHFSEGTTYNGSWVKGVLTVRGRKLDRPPATKIAVTNR